MSDPDTDWVRTQEFLRSELERRESRNTFLWTVTGSALAGLIFVGGITYEILGSHRWNESGEHQLHLLAGLTLVLFGLPLIDRLLELLHPTVKSSAFTSFDAVFLDRCMMKSGWPPCKRWSSLVRAGALAYLSWALAVTSNSLPWLAGVLTFCVFVSLALPVVWHLSRVVVTGQFAARLISTVYHGLATASPDVQQELRLGELYAKPLVQPKPIADPATVRNMFATLRKAGQAFGVIKWVLVAGLVSVVIFSDSSHQSFPFLLDAGAVSLTVILFAVILLVGVDLYYDHSREWVSQIQYIHLRGGWTSGFALSAYDIVETARYHGFHSPARIAEFLHNLEFRPIQAILPDAIPIAEADSHE